MSRLAEADEHERDVAESPYKGLAPFDESEPDTLLFFGRERERDVVTANLMASPVTVLFGPSGVGKTSLLRAGVAYPLRRLARENIDTRGEAELAVVVYSAWDGDPVEGLRGAVAEAVGDVLGEPPERPSTARASLADVAAAATRRVGGDLYLILDQFEEYFLYHGSDRGPQTLLGQLPELVDRPGLRVNLLVAIRDDELAKLDVLKPRIPALFGNFLRLDHLDREAARRAVLGPVERYNALTGAQPPVSVEPDLVDAVLDEVTTGRIEPGLAGRGVVESGDGRQRVEAPYLQLVMQTLWQVERSGGSPVLRLETFRRLGGAQRIVRNHLERAMTSLTPREQDVAAAMFDHLVTPSGMKVAHALPDLATYASASTAEVEPIVQSLARERILRPLGDSRDGDHRCEIFHDVLAEAVLAWRTRHEGRRALERERRAAARRYRRVAGVAAAALLALIVLAGVTVYAFAQRGEAKEQARAAQARELAATAFAQLGMDPELSMLLALEAARREPTRRVEEALRRALIESRARAVAEIGGGKRILGTALAPEGSLAVSVADDGILRTFALDSGRLVDSRSLGGPVRAASFTSNRRFLVTDGPGSAVRVWHAAQGEPMAAFRQATPVRSASVSANGAFVATAGADGRVRVYDVRRRRLQRSLSVDATPTAVEMSADGSRIAIGRADGTTRIVDRRSGEVVSDLVGHTGWVVSASFSRLGGTVATGSTDGTARVWSVTPGRLIAVMTGHGNFVTSTAVSADGRVVITGSRDRTARVWDATSGRQLAVLRGHGDPVRAAALADDATVAVTGSLDGTARVWDVATEPRLAVARRFRGAVADVDGDRSGAVLVAASGDDAFLWRRGAGAKALAHAEPVAAGTVSADGDLAATAAGRRVVLWRVASGTVARVLTTPTPVSALAFSPRRTVLAAAGTDGVRLWRTDGRVARTLPSTSPVNGVAFDPRGERLIAAAADGAARIWDVRTGRLLVELRGHERAVNAAEFSPDGRLAVTASDDHDARVWDAETGRTVRVLSGHFGAVSDVGFNPDGRWVVTAGPVSAALWDARSGALTFYLRGHDGRVTSALFASDRNDIVTAGTDGTVRTYLCDICGTLAQLVTLAEERLGRTGRALTPSERRRYHAER